VLESQGREFLQQWYTVSYTVLAKVCWKWWWLRGKSNLIIAKRCMNHPCKFHCYCNYIFWEKTGGIISIQPLICKHTKVICCQ
jgi:hypothetical protein